MNPLWIGAALALAAAGGAAAVLAVLDDIRRHEVRLEQWETLHTLPPED